MQPGFAEDALEGMPRFGQRRLGRVSARIQPLHQLFEELLLTEDRAPVHVAVLWVERVTKSVVYHFVTVPAHLET